MTNKPLLTCPLCATDLRRAIPISLSRYADHHLVRCRVCGFVFSRLAPTAEDYERVYGAYNYSGEDAARTELNIQKERSIVNGLMRYRSTGLVLDIAAGAGRFLERFAERGFSCHATEFSEPMCQFLEDKGIRTFRGGLFPEGAEPGSYDIVVFTEIIEHINNPIPVLHNIHRLLRPGGALYITTPNFSSLERRLLKSDWGMICWPEHITYWTSRHLHRALRETGYSKKLLRTQNISPYRVMQALKKGPMKAMVSDVSEQSFSDSAQRKVAGNLVLRGGKNLVNLGLRATRLGSSIEAIYVKAAKAPSEHAE
jgi:2-polyprenyl-3-methyl-5-hydroxy-6-metoxy-1,4-benzoquinol methylase